MINKITLAEIEDLELVKSLRKRIRLMETEINQRKMCNKSLQDALKLVLTFASAPEEDL